MEYSILMTLHDHPTLSLAADLVRTGRFTKSHVSSSLKQLERKQMVSRFLKEGNSRNWHIRISDKAAGVIAEGDRIMADMETILFQGFSQEEICQYKHFYERVIRNAENALRPGIPVVSEK